VSSHYQLHASADYLFGFLTEIQLYNVIVYNSAYLKDPEGTKKKIADVYASSSGQGESSRC
jgi:hypothetical protein